MFWTCHKCGSEWVTQIKTSKDSTSPKEDVAQQSICDGCLDQMSVDRKDKSDETDAAKSSSVY